MRRTCANRSRWPTQAIATTTKLMRNATNEGRISSSASRRPFAVASSGTWISSTSRVMTMANTPSDNAMTPGRVVRALVGRLLALVAHRAST